MKEQGLILEIYRKMYAEIGVDFDSVDKTENMWFWSYFLSQKRQNEIIEDVLKRKRLTKLKKTSY